MAGFKINDRLKELEAQGEKFVSFEFFPPKTDEGVKALMSRAERYSKQGSSMIVDRSSGHADTSPLQALVAL